MSREHKAKALKDLKFKIVVVSSSRYRRLMKGEEVKDESGELAGKLIKNYGYEITNKVIIPDDPEEIRRSIKNSLNEADVIIFIGGTGVGLKDYTYEVIKEIIEKELEGFGEIFRFLSYREIGSSAIISRACAGIVNGKLLACIPGSKSAVKLALEKLLLPEAGHILLHARKG
ncbi:MAG: molybdenum cofactor biosynthesis protein MoaB [archaeon GB-1867-005]|nr:molybdenum cofactor biosynthesis protein MoaB [Candidatus Culexmicrobium cathedralense]